MELRILLLVVAAATTMRWAHAQPATDPTSQGSPSRGSTTIPVTMPADAETLGAEKSANNVTTGQMSIEQPVDPDTYVCGPGDTFELAFWGQQNFRLRLAVDLEGKTFISKVGFVTVAGKSLSAARKVIKERVRANYPGLQFELTLVMPRTFAVHIVENVKQPGVYTANPLERISVAIQRAGGISGSKRRITVKHRDGSSTVADLLMYELTGDTKYNPFLIDGDVVKVPVAEVTITIAGPVARPGSYELVKSKDLAEALDLAGGLTGAVAKTLPIRVVRRNQNQHERFENLSFVDGAVPNTSLRDLDQIFIPGVQELQRTVLLIGAVAGAETVDAASASKRLPFVEGDTVSSLLQRAGGITAPGDLKRSYIARARRGQSPVIPIDLEALLVRRDLKADVPIQMGDTIVVPPLRYSISVEGAVTRPGLYQYNPLFSVSEYVSRAGGRTRTAQELESARLTDVNGRTRKYGADAKLNPGDAILIPERNWTRSEIVQLVMSGTGLLLSIIVVSYTLTR